ncbi:MAG: hypothetical protein KIT84_26740 [Labilithrix sp.]|nr:hypothetical protein [Labilithrix sp.]MCW5814652.1 hypothetical protein [Labilithrix sp.]
MKTIAKLVAVALAIIPATLATTSDASACGMSVRLEPVKAKPTPVQEIARAEKSLEGGNNKEAAQVVLASFSNVRNATAGANPLETRALRVFALAIVRSGGAVNERNAGSWSQNEWTPSANLEWAVQSLREIDAKRPNDPTVQADLGEALSKLPRTQDEALKLLGGLAQKDLMGSPFAYAALAKIKGAKGDTAGAEAAIKRCEEMTKAPGVCKPATPAAPAKPAPAARA